MDLWLLRHAAAEERSSSGRDEDRELTAEGARRARAVASGLASLETGIELILTSPYRRARQTAESAAGALRLDKNLRVSEALEPASAPEEILQQIDAEQCEAILLVGHQPHLGALLGWLVGGERGLEIPLKKAAVARVELESRRRGSLRALLPARVLEELGRSRR